MIIFKINPLHCMKGEGESEGGGGQAGEAQGSGAMGGGPGRGMGPSGSQAGEAVGAEGAMGGGQQGGGFGGPGPEATFGGPGPGSVGEGLEAAEAPSTFMERFAISQAINKAKMKGLPTPVKAMAAFMAPPGVPTSVLGTVASAITAMFNDVADPGPGPDLGPGADPSGDGQDYLRAVTGSLGSEEYFKNLTGGNVADTDLINDLYSSVGLSRDPISFKLGDQDISVVPKAQRDELSMLLNYLLGKEQTAQGARQLDLEEPSFVDKSSQLIGLGSDVLSLWESF